MQKWGFSAIFLRLVHQIDLFCLKIQCNNVQNRTHLFVQNICVTDHIKSSLTLSLPSNSWFENEVLVDFLDFGWLDLFAIAGFGSTKRT